MLHGGCWNSVGQRVIYAAESYAGAMLEVLVHANLSVPPRNHRVVRITIPAQVITQGRENNILINPLHPQFAMIVASEPEPIHWDAWLFAQVQGR